MIQAIISYEDGRVSIHSAGVKEVGTQFVPGFYSAYTDNQGNINIQIEKLEELHNPYKTKQNEILMTVIDNFFSDEIYIRIKELGFIHKIGVLLFGQAGTTKTSMMNFIAQKLITEKGGICFFCSNGNELTTAISLAHSIREIQDNPIVFIADEFENYANKAESEMKNLLDGNKSIQNSLFLAATNYIDQIPDTLKKRPSRFKIVMEMKGITDKILMKKILKNISKKITPSLFTKEEINEIVKPLESVTMDELKHICLDKATGTYIPDKFKEDIRPTIGFNKVSDDDNDDWDSEGTIGGEVNKFTISIGEIFRTNREKESYSVNTQSNI